MSVNAAKADWQCVGSMIAWRTGRDTRKGVTVGNCQISHYLNIPLPLITLTIKTRTTVLIVAEYSTARGLWLFEHGFNDLPMIKICHLFWRTINIYCIQLFSPNVEHSGVNFQTVKIFMTLHVTNANFHDYIFEVV